MLAGSRCKDILDLTGGQNTILHTQKHRNCKAKMLEFILKQYCIRRNILIAATVQSSRSMRQIPAVLIREFIPQIKPTYKK